MKISIVVPTYKRSQLLKRCLDSLVLQSRPPDEVIVVTQDDDSASLGVVTHFEEKCGRRNTRLKNVKASRLGLVHSYNEGLQRVSGDVVGFIDDDSIAPGDWIKRLEKHYKDPMVGGVGGPTIPYFFGEPLIEKSKFVGKVPWFGCVVDNLNKLSEKPIWVDHLCGTNMSFRRELMKEFDENLIGRQFRFEMDLCLSIKKRGYKIIFDPNARVYHCLVRLESKLMKRTSKSFIEHWSHAEIYEICCNNTYVLLKHFSPPQKIVFLLFTFLIGDAASFGLVTTSIRVLKYKNPRILKELIPAFRGKLKGILLHRSLASKTGRGDL